MDYVTAYFGSALLALFLMPLVSRLAKKHGFVDLPGPRRVHEKPIPRIGGIAFVVPVLALTLSWLFSSSVRGMSLGVPRGQLLTTLGAAAFIFAVGFIDDVRSVPGPIKLLCLIAAALAVCVSGATLRSIPIGTWYQLQTGGMAWPVTVFWILAATVCMNLIDGLDGLAGGVAVVVCGLIALVAFWSGQPALVLVMLALLGGVTGFLFFNFHPAQIFMGDGGSLFLGFVIGAASTVCQANTSLSLGLVLPVLALAVPILDAALVILRRRLLDRRSIFAPDRSHLHHRLLDLGLPHRSAVLTIHVITALNAGVGVFLLKRGGGHAVALLGGSFLLLLLLFACSHRANPGRMLAVLRRNWTLARQAKKERCGFETAEVKMRDARSPEAWWRVLCEMGRQMHFQSLELWCRRNGHSERSCAWSAPAEPSATGRTARLGLPLRAEGETTWEIRALLRVNGCLESSGRQGMLLARLVDEFPPPQVKRVPEEAPAEAYAPGVDAEAGIYGGAHDEGGPIRAARYSPHARSA
jgi:UDP-GlcNAc:undecaprenyl-phosphate GlcNAc-1-phosphate transferase